MELNDLKIREIILNLREPHVIKNMKLPWKCFDIAFQNWCQLYDDAKENEDETVAEFEFAPRKYIDSPQWERLRKAITLKFSEFYEKITTNEKDDFIKENWIGFNYKNIEGLPNICKNDISFTPFGFADVNDDITFWMGSENAHTPCHYDTYGCNVVVQVYGRKMWLLFPPTTSLTPIRIPYEESSVYCSETFYSPNDLSKFQSISKDCYKCILEPGDILIVPNKWWHYVENLSPALNFNCWIPLEADYKTTIDECIVKFIIEPIFSNAPEGEKLKFEILNPNEEIVGEGIILHLLEHLIEDELPEKFNLKKYPYQYLSKIEVENLIKTINNENSEKKIIIENIENISEEEFMKILKLNSSRYIEKHDNINSLSTVKEILINSICDPKIISTIRENFISRYSKSQIMKKYEDKK